ncbi:MAG: SMC-Scp complex subunit ScpB [Candidatus Marinimicrobia bacterium]|nr:SMC-Scp complex subunit ScpB [Candidatus Neomarinimicrobiota bacterium]MBL7046476.1 SMC-Scp complex subunit ScpB [Candidatus Neomarinimicrobiota bacterium]
MAKEAFQQEEIQIVEALLFSSLEPLRQSKVDICFNGDAPKLQEVISLINKRYERNGNPFFVEKVARGYRLVTRPEFDPWIRRLHTRMGRTSLTRASLEVLSIIAYKGPVSRMEIESIRGVQSGSSVKTLLEKDLIKIKCRSDGPGRPLLYSVTDAFLVSFGLETLSDLPKIRDISELTSEHTPTDVFNNATE